MAVEYQTRQLAEETTANQMRQHIQAKTSGSIHGNLSGLSAGFSNQQANVVGGVDGLLGVNLQEKHNHTTGSHAAGGAE